MSTNTEYLSTADVAKIIRNDLKQAFPGHKFSVRSSNYAGGSSIHIEWTDGPSDSEVDDLIGHYAGSGFDGSIDMAYCYYHVRLPDGRIVRSGSQGTEGSKGYAPKWHEDFPGAVPVHCGVSYVQTNRHNSREAQQAALDKMVEERYITADAYTWHEEKTERWGLMPAWWEWTDNSDRIYLDRIYHQFVGASRYVKPAPAPERPTTTHTTAPAGEMTITEEGSWLWVAFPCKPADDVIARLKELGARWSKKRAAWYLTDSSKAGAVMALT